MPAERRTMAVNKFPLRLMPSVRKSAEEHSKREGVSLNQFINLAVAEKVAHLQHDQWLARRPRLNAEMVERALEVLDLPSPCATADEDWIPESYIPLRGGAITKK